MAQPNWHDAIKITEYDKQYQSFDDYFEDYFRWFNTKSAIARYVMKVGLIMTAFAALLSCLNGFTFKIPVTSNTSDGIITALLSLASIAWLILYFLDDTVVKGFIGNLKKLIALRIAPLIVLLLPCLFYLFESKWEETISTLGVIGLATTIIAYLINRLEGYTRAASRYRTARFKIQINHCQWQRQNEQLTQKLEEAKNGNNEADKTKAQQAIELNDRQAQQRLLNIVNAEIEDRHKDIISDFHFFGDSVTNLLRKK